MSRSTQTAAPLETRSTPNVSAGVLTIWRSFALALIAGVGASLCCLPILFLLAGAGGAWMATLTAMEPYRPYFMGLTVVFLGLAIRKLYFVPRTCAIGEGREMPRTLRHQRALLWVITVAVLLLVGIPWYAPLLIG